MKEKYLIGEFSTMTHLSKRVLRHYDAIDLLNPDEKSVNNQYRYYSNNQIKEAEKILLLKNLGLSLEEIKNVINSDINLEGFLQLLNDKQATIRQSIEKDVYVLSQIKKFIQTFKNSCKAVNEQLELEIKKEKSGDKMSIEKETSITRMYMDTKELFVEQEKWIEKYPNETPCYLATFDIDHFAEVNQKFGHLVGDAVIYQTFNAIEKYLKVFLTRYNGFYARTGGDEISLFAIGVEKKVLLESIKNCIKEVDAFDFSKVDCPLKLTVSAGIFGQSDQMNISAMKHESIKALMVAKGNGGNQWYLIEK